ncbi:unnamed protein product [Euphydryas editha]|uniref:Uncharacterized protein n=1 Tax=Euphydryas editha TaxID=104508 RepID=A0AAU9UMM4_EUPED|nr:unnamed protein product [Euphydryas editha]
MAPLSRELAGLILPHDRFGSHLDERGVTIDEHLKRSNFEFAGNVLAEVWSSMEIDGYNVTAKYVGAEHHDVEWLDENDVDIPKSDESEQTHNTEQQSNVIENLESWIRVS